jgi:hypothetical protein
LFNRLGLAYHNSKELFQRNLILALIVLSFGSFSRVFMGVKLNETILSVLMVFLIVDSFYARERIKIFFISGLKILGSTIFIFLLNLAALFIPAILAIISGVFSQGGGGIISLIVIPIGIIGLFFFFIMNLWFTLTPFYIIDGFPIVESIKYSYHAVREYSLYGLIIGGGLIMSILIVLINGIIGFGLALLTTILVPTVGGMLSEIFIFIIVLGMYLVSYRFLSWNVNYLIGIYEDTNDVVL